MESLPLIYRAKSNIYRFRFIQTEEASLKKNTHKRLHTTINNEEVHFRKKSCCRQRPEEIFFYREQRKDRRVLLRGCLICVTPHFFIRGSPRGGAVFTRCSFVSFFFIMRVSECMCMNFATKYNFFLNFTLYYVILFFPLSSSSFRIESKTHSYARNNMYKERRRE